MTEQLLTPGDQALYSMNLHNGRVETVMVRIEEVHPNDRRQYRVTELEGEGYGSQFDCRHKELRPVLEEYRVVYKVKGDEDTVSKTVMARDAEDAVARTAEDGHYVLTVWQTKGNEK